MKERVTKVTYRELTTRSGETLKVYEARPTASRPRGGVILIHEIWGLVPHIIDIADRFSRAGFVVFAPDILSYAGVPPSVGSELERLRFSNDDEIRVQSQPRIRETLMPARSPAYGRWAVAALCDVLDDLASEPGIDGNLAVVGFCFGGTYSFALAAADKRIRAAVPFYGAPPETTELGAIECPILAFYGDQDETLIKDISDLERRMELHNVDFTAKIYPGRKHAFFNDSNPTTFSPDAAVDAWQRTLSFIDKAVTGES